MSTPTTPSPAATPSDALTPEERAALAEMESRLYMRRLPRLPRWLIGALGLVVAAGLVGFGQAIALAVFLGWLTFAVVLIIVSRLIEGARRSKDRCATLLVTTAFVIALLPLAGMLYEVVSKGAG